ncbi:MAG: hypothetical protein CM1200mP36_00440 [Gammaproteobacteria bacterium]|nr:MAG: hypothetical protein CM1200mP36_00440 [Gammaproteobacteria bacterium]
MSFLVFFLSRQVHRFLGTDLAGAVTQWTGSLRWGISVVLVMFVVGMLILIPLDEENGTARAGRNR